MTDHEQISGADRQALIRIAKGRAKQAEREAKTREKILITEVLELITAEYSAQDAMWAEAVIIADEAAAKANAVIQARCADMGIPPNHAPRIELGWSARSSEFRRPGEMREKRELAEKRSAAITSMAITEIHEQVRQIEEKLILGGLESDEARALVESMPAVEALMPAITLEQVGIRRWVMDEDAADKLTSPRSTADWRARKVFRAIELNPGASDRRIGEIAGVDHKTVGKYRRLRGELPGIRPEDADDVLGALGGDSPDDSPIGGDLGGDSPDDSADGAGGE